jgi:hypothetical protein
VRLSSRKVPHCGFGTRADGGGQTSRSSVMLSFLDIAESVHGEDTDAHTNAKAGQHGDLQAYEFEDERYPTAPRQPTLVLTFHTRLLPMGVKCTQ